jgi:hypothetical protein
VVKLEDLADFADRVQEFQLACELLVEDG